jgi:peptide/nickel transport system substrate-binding protein
MKRAQKSALVAAVLAPVLTLTACGGGGGGSSDASKDSIIVGTTDKAVAVDPAGAYDTGSATIQWQVYQFLLNYPAGATTPQPDAAEECGFTQPTEYTCTMRDGLTFANGDPLTAESVRFSFQRIVDIADPNGPSSVLGNMKSVEVQDGNKVVFTLNTPDDQTFPQVLTTVAGPIVDEKVYPADKLLSDQEAVEAKGFSGPYTITDYQKNQLVAFEANPDYAGSFGKAKASMMVLKYYTDANNLKLDMGKNNIDIAWRALSPTDIASLDENDNVTVHTGPGGELRYMVFNLDTMPGDDDAQKLAVRQAIATSVDRDAIATEVYRGTYKPAYSSVPPGIPGATEAFKDMYGATPDPDKAAAYLADAGVETPVTVNLQYNPDHYGASSAEEYGAVKRQLEDTGLFEVELQSTEWVTYQKERVADSYPVYQLGWFPDYPDADTYVSPFYGPNNFLLSHYSNPAMDDLIAQEQTEQDPTARAAIFGEIQTLAAQDIPILPLLLGNQVAVSGNDIEGVEDTLDTTYTFRFTSFSKK